MFRKRAYIAAKQEVTPGTAETLSGTYAAINFWNVKHAKVDFGQEEREKQGSFDRFAATQGATQATIEFDTEVVGTGATGDVNSILSDLICACGYTVAGGVFTPTSNPASMTTVTIGDYTDGNRRILSGCTGNFTITTTNGRKSMFHFTMTGIPAAETATALITPTLPTLVAPRGAASFSINGVTNLRIAQFTFDSGSQPHMLESIIAPSGFAFGITDDRMSKATLDPEATLVSTNDWDTLITTPTEFALSVVFGSASHNTITLAAVGNKAQLKDREYGARQGVMIDTLNLDLNSGETLTFA